MPWSSYSECSALSQLFHSLSTNQKEKKMGEIWFLQNSKALLSKDTMKKWKGKPQRGRKYLQNKNL